MHWPGSVLCKTFVSPVLYNTKYITVKVKKKIFEKAVRIINLYNNEIYLNPKMVNRFASSKRMCFVHITVIIYGLLCNNIEPKIYIYLYKYHLYAYYVPKRISYILCFSLVE